MTVRSVRFGLGLVDGSHHRCDLKGYGVMECFRERVAVDVCSWGS